MPTIKKHQFYPHSSDNGVERLAYMGNFELSFSHEFQFLEASYPDGGYESTLVGPVEGVVEVSLTFKQLDDSELRVFMTNNTETTLAMYLYNFFIRHNSPAKKSFIAPHPLTAVDTLWRFKEHRIDFNNIFVRLWGSGIPLIQDFDGEPVVDTSQNMDTI